MRTRLVRVLRLVSKQTADGGERERENLSGNDKSLERESYDRFAVRKISRLLLST